MVEGRKEGKKAGRKEGIRKEGRQSGQLQAPDESDDVDKNMKICGRENHK